MNLQTWARAERGRGTALAAKLGVSAVIVSQWITGARLIPSHRAPDIERATDGEVKVVDVAPWERWVRVPDKKWPHPKGRPCLDCATRWLREAA